MSNLQKILNENSWMIHDLRDANEIDNKEERRLVVTLEKAKKEVEAVRDFLLRLKKWLEENDSLASDSIAHSELDVLLGRMEWKNDKEIQNP